MNVYELKKLNKIEKRFRCKTLEENRTSVSKYIESKEISGIKRVLEKVFTPQSVDTIISERLAWPLQLLDIKIHIVHPTHNPWSKGKKIKLYRSDKLIAETETTI